jgi:HK97 family phage portal protein
MAVFQISTVLGWFGWVGGALGERRGRQRSVPASSVVQEMLPADTDLALQIDAVWACVDRRAKAVASLPLFVYDELGDGRKRLDRTSRLAGVLTSSPNGRMTPYDFWRCMLLNHDLRGNAYARIERAPDGEAVALVPMPADQVEPEILPDGSMVYRYQLGSDVAVLAEENVLHLRDLGNGTMGADKLSFMRAGLNEAIRQVQSASNTWGNAGKPTGVLMVDSVLKPDQRKALLDRFGEMAMGNTARLHLLEAQMKYQQISMTPEQQQLLESRRYGVEQFSRWYDVPPVLIHHANVTAWGSGIEQIVDGWHKLAIRPLLVGIEQALKKRVFTPAQRARKTCEFSHDAMLRTNAKARGELYALQVQNGLKTRNECRALENDPPSTDPLADQLTVQSQMVPLHMMGRINTGGPRDPAQAPQAQ